MRRNQAVLRFILKAMFLLALLAVPFAAGAADKRSYTLAVIPNLPAVTQHKSWNPFVEQLAQVSGVRIELKLYDKIGTFLDDCNAGIPDFIYSAPNMFFLIHQRQKYIPLVRSSQMIRGQVFVRKDAPYSSVKELSGKTIAFVGPKNVCSVITRHALLTGAGAIDYNAAYSGSTVNVAKSVLLGKADAGATLDTAMLDLQEMRDEFRILMETEKIASHPLAAHPRVPEKVRSAITNGVLSLAKSESGRRLLSVVRLSDPVKADFKRDYGMFADVDFNRLDRQQGR